MAAKPLGLDLASCSSAKALQEVLRLCTSRDQHTHHQPSQCHQYLVPTVLLNVDGEALTKGRRVTSNLPNRWRG